MWSDYGVTYIETTLEDPVTYTETYAETYVLYLVLCSHTHVVSAFTRITFVSKVTCKTVIIWAGADLYYRALCRAESGRAQGVGGIVTGSVRAEHAYSGISCGALRLEVGKSPTATPRRAELPVA